MKKIITMFLVVAIMSMGMVFAAINQTNVTKEPGWRLLQVQEWTI